MVDPSLRAAKTGRITTTEGSTTDAATAAVAGALASVTSSGGVSIPPQPLSTTSVTQKHVIAAPVSPQRSSISNFPSIPSSPRPSTGQDTPQQHASPIILTTPQHAETNNGNRPLPHIPLVDDSGMALGLEQLERQQAEAERRRQQYQLNNNSNSSINNSSEDATTNDSNKNSNKNSSRNNNNNSNHSNNSSAAAPQVLMTPPEMLPLRPAPVPQSVIEQYSEDDEISTEPSSTVTGNTTDNARGSSVVGDGEGDGEGDEDEEDDFGDGNSLGNPPTKIGRFIESAKRRLPTSFPRKDEEEDPAEEDQLDDETLIGGHLQKLGRNGKWQTRWFETDGECLSYYKTNKRAKLLATLDLAKVGSICVNEEDTKGCSFTIQVLGRPYHLRAESKAACKDWVITLNRVKEARMQQGNIKLVAPTSQGPPDFLDANLSEYTPQIVALANRQRTTAVDDMESLELPHAESPGDGDFIDNDGSISSISQVVLAQWQKRRTKLSRLASKLARWARSLKKYNCTDIETQPVLDPRVHPPGHDDKSFPLLSGGSKVTCPAEPGVGSWTCKETRSGATPEDPPAIDSKASDSLPHISSASISHDEQEETRELS